MHLLLFFNFLNFMKNFLDLWSKVTESIQLAQPRTSHIHARVCSFFLVLHSSQRIHALLRTHETFSHLKETFSLSLPHFCFQLIFLSLSTHFSFLLIYWFILICSSLFHIPGNDVHSVPCLEGLWVFFVGPLIWHRQERVVIRLGSGE